MTTARDDTESARTGRPDRSSEGSASMIQSKVTVLGSINMDIVLGVARFPQPGETVVAPTVMRSSGGKGANQAIAAARAGARVRMIGAVGDDENGRALLAALAADGVDCEAIRIDRERMTGTAFVLVDGTGENQIVVAAGANAAAGVSIVSDERVRLAQLELPLEVVASFLTTRAPGSIAILNAAPFQPASDRLLALADIIVVNEVELAAYSGRRDPPRSCAQAMEMARALLVSDGQTIIVTRGRAGSVAVRADWWAETPAAAATVVDTTGAGDCFCGYLAAGIAAGQTLTNVIARAHRAAAISVGRWGAATSIPHSAELDAAA